MQGYNVPATNWAPMNSNYGNPYTWQPSYPTYSGTGSHLRGAPQPAQQPSTNVVKVAGPESAKAFSAGANAFLVLFDESRPIFYSKTTDDGGFPSIRAFKFEEIPLDSILAESQGAAAAPPVDDLRKDIDTLKASFAETQSDISELKKMLEGLVG